MYFIFDHLNAIIVSAVLVFILAWVMFQMQETNMETTLHRQKQTQALDLIEMLERDLRNVGSGVDLTDDMILAYQWDEDNRYLEFLSISDTSEAATVEQIRYELESSDSLMVVDQGVSQRVPAYTLHRKVFSGGSYITTGSSQPMITELSVSLLDADSTPVTVALNATRIIEVQLKVASNLDTDEGMPVTVWETRFRPVSLFLRDT